MSTNAYCDVVEYPQWYIRVMHGLALFSTPTNLFCGYVILCHSPTQMRVYKRHLIFFHIASSTLDILFSSGVIPVIIFPFPMGYPAGFLGDIGLASSWLTHMTIMMVVFTLITVIVLFFYRLQVVLPMNHPFKLRSTPYLMFVLFLFFVNEFPIAVMVKYTLIPNVYEAKYNFSQEYPCLRYIIMREDLYIFDFEHPDIIRYVKFVCLSISSLFFFSLGCILLSFYYLKKNNNLSNHTRRLQRKLMFQLIYQVALPFSVMMVPVLTYFTIIIWKIPRTQTIGNIIFILCASHGTVSSISILYLNEKYRKAVASYFGCCKNMRNNFFQKHKVSSEIRVPTYADLNRKATVSAIENM